MKITDIKQQVKRQDRYSIYVDGKYSFSLSENELLNIGLRINQEFSESELEQLKKTAIEDKAMMRAYDQLSRRARSEWEMRDYLRRKDYEPELIDKIIIRLKDRKYLNDEQFAKAWVENRRLLKKTSKRKLSQELKQKRVDEATINKVLAEDETDEQEVLRELIARKSQQSRYQDEQKLIAYLLRQGFSYDDIKSVINEDI
jgi:regulatory protein